MENRLAAIDELYIDGSWLPPDARSYEAVVNPATEEEIGRAPMASVAQLDAAVAAARTAFESGPWPRMSFAERADIMQRMHHALERRLPQIQALIVAEAGSTVALANSGHTVAPLRHLAYGISLARRIEPVSTPPEVSQWPGLPDAIGATTTIREPLGVVAGITGYNFPFLLNLAKVAPALLAGNTLVLKPSPFTPFSALLFGEVCDEIGLPRGVLNVVNGGVDTAVRLTSHPDVDLISFTGSDTVGAQIAAQAAPTLKRLVMELGGKSAMIVRADADIEQAAIRAASTFTVHCGQGCALLTRYLVHNSVRPAFVAAVKAALAHWKVGDPSDPSVQMGPLIRDSQRQRVEKYVQSGLDSGATLVSGGKRPSHLRRGYFFEPTLFDNVDNSTPIAQDEIFGPVATVTGFDKDDEAVSIANQSSFGLAAGVMSADRAQAYRMALQVRAGTVWMNGGFGGDMTSHAPFGGSKRSGYGREYGAGWLDEYLNQKSISFPIG